MEKKEIYQIRKSLEAFYEQIGSFVSPWAESEENDNVLLGMRYHIRYAIRLSRKLKGGVE